MSLTTNQIKAYANGVKFATISSADAISIPNTFEVDTNITDIGQVARGIKRKVQEIKIKTLMGSDTESGTFNDATFNPSIRSIALQPQNTFKLTLVQGSKSVSGNVSVKDHGEITALPSETFEMTFISLGTDFRNIYIS